jgi:hypothetical protein
MLAMIRTFPTQRSQVSISMRNTRFSRCAHVMARCRSARLRSVVPVLRFRKPGVGRETASEITQEISQTPFPFR